MDTTILNNPATGAEGKSEKNEKAKKIAGKAAQFAAAAGIGSAATVAASAMTTPDEPIEEIAAEVEEVPAAETPGGNAPHHHTVTATPATDFNPNDIVIDPQEVEVGDNGGSEAVVQEVHPVEAAGDIAVVEPQPITGEDILVVNPNEVMLEIDPNEISACEYGGPDDWDDFDHEELLAGGDDVIDEIDLADDIL